jgi:hypothetical protein
MPVNAQAMVTLANQLFPDGDGDVDLGEVVRVVRSSIGETLSVAEFNKLKLDSARHWAYLTSGGRSDEWGNRYERMDHAAARAAFVAGVAALEIGGDMFETPNQVSSASRAPRRSGRGADEAARLVAFAQEEGELDGSDALNPRARSRSAGVPGKRAPPSTRGGKKSALQARAVTFSPGGPNLTAHGSLVLSQEQQALLRGTQGHQGPQPGPQGGPQQTYAPPSRGPQRHQAPRDTQRGPLSGGVHSQGPQGQHGPPFMGPPGQGYGQHISSSRGPGPQGHGGPPSFADYDSRSNPLAHRQNGERVFTGNQTEERLWEGDGAFLREERVVPAMYMPADPRGSQRVPPSSGAPPRGPQGQHGPPFDMGHGQVGNGGFGVPYSGNPSQDIAAQHISSSRGLGPQGHGGPPSVADYGTRSNPLAYRQNGERVSAGIRNEERRWGGEGDLPDTLPAERRRQYGFEHDGSHPMGSPQSAPDFDQGRVQRFPARQAGRQHGRFWVYDDDFGAPTYPGERDIGGFQPAPVPQHGHDGPHTSHYERDIGRFQPGPLPRGAENRARLTQHQRGPLGGWDHAKYREIIQFMREMNRSLKAELSLKGAALQHFVASGREPFYRMHSNEGEDCEYLLEWFMRTIPSSYTNMFDFVMDSKSGFIVGADGKPSRAAERECATLATAFDVLMTVGPADTASVLLRRLLAWRRCQELRVPQKKAGGGAGAMPADITVWDRAGEIESQATRRGESSLPAALRAAFAARRKADKGDALD